MRTVETLAYARCLRARARPPDATTLRQIWEAKKGGHAAA